MPLRSLFAPLAALALSAAACAPRPPLPVEGFEAAEGLEMTLWAAEPLLVNPTNFDIDERGRVWLIESVNYRSDLKRKPRNDPAGDRIVILEDTDGDGRADSRKIFDQQPEMLAPLGISVFGDKVLVSQSPDLIVYAKDENDNIVGKETLLTGWGGIDHDHGLHAVIFGHDGRYYFNSGDQGFDMTDESGKRHRSSREGPYYAATVQRMNPDGSAFEVLAHNARNPYEIAFDSFGSIWQTDNDDDGNKWTRLLYVVEGANFGYWGPGGRRWHEDRGTHFHAERPGTMPFVARTGPGSPTGLVFYEGDLLPEKYRGQLLHAEPGKRLIQTFFVEPAGAGYAMRHENTVATVNPDFRPSDLAVAPDGSIFIADWNDPAVGGHNMQDIDKGRIYRLAPAGHAWSVPQLDLETDEGLAAAFGSPNQATRVRAYRELQLRGADAKRVLSALWRGDNETLRARALWLAAPMGVEGEAALEEALADADPRFRVLGLRAARLHGMDAVGRAKALTRDPSPHVRREAAIALRNLDPADRIGPWLELAEGYDGQDRWYLETLRIAAAGAEDRIFAALRAKYPDWNADVGDLYWVLQAPSSAPYLRQILHERSLTLEQRAGALEALGWQPSAEAAMTVAALAGDPAAEPPLRKRAFYFLGKQLYSEWSAYRRADAALAAVNSGLENPDTRQEALELAGVLADPAFGRRLLRLARDAGLDEASRKAALEALGAVGGGAHLAVLRETALAAGPDALRIAAVNGLGAARPDDMDATLRQIVLSESSNEVRSAALRVLGRRPSGLHAILDMEESLDLPAELRTVAAGVVHAGRDPAVRERAAAILPAPESKNNRALARMRPIVEAVGDVERGRAVFNDSAGADCAKCHSLESGGESVGPSLAAIGSKYAKEGLFDSILNPSAGIAPEYYSWILDTTTYGIVTGVLAEDSPERVVVRTETGDEIRLEPAEVLERRRSMLSIMPEDLVNAMTEQELIDLLEFLASLREGTLREETAAVR